MRSKKRTGLKWMLIGILAIAVILVGSWVWLKHNSAVLPEGIAVCNGRLEATQIEIASKNAGRVAEVLVKEGDRVSTGQVVARMDVESLKAQLAEALAQVDSAKSSKVTDLALVRQRRSSLTAAEAQVAQQRSELSIAQKTFDRTKALLVTNAASRQQFDDDQSKLESSRALLAAAMAQEEEARAEIDVAESQVTSADAATAAARATVSRIQTDLSDDELKAPQSGRIEHQLVQQGEVVGAGGAVLEMVDLTDVYMTVFLPEVDAGKLLIGGEARLVFDAAPHYVIPAKVSYVASEAQFTPKTVETMNEREQLVFEVKLQLSPEGLAKYEPLVKVGMPGVAYVRLDSSVRWPSELRVRLPPEQAMQP